LGTVVSLEGGDFGGGAGGVEAGHRSGWLSMCELYTAHRIHCD
jgi:hypothetical protein